MSKCVGKGVGILILIVIDRQNWYAAIPKIAHSLTGGRKVGLWKVVIEEIEERTKQLESKQYHL